MPPQLHQTFVTDSEMVGDLVVERLPHAIHECARGPIGPHVRPTEEGDLARDRGAIRAVCGARYALVETKEPASIHAGQLAWTWLVLDDDGHARKLPAIRLGHRVDGGCYCRVE